METPYPILVVFCLLIGVHTDKASDGIYCPSGWHMAEGACFKMTEPMSWYEARDECQNQKGNLAYFDSTKQFNMAASMFSEGPKWIGLFGSGARADRKYSWINNVQAPLSFKQWDVDEPSLGSTACVAMYKGEADDEMGWQDEPCYRQLPFICQQKKDGDRCDFGWDEYAATGLCLKLSGQKKLNWLEAKRYCEEQRATKLAILDSDDINTFVLDVVIKLPGSSWIGMWDPNMNDNWQWTDMKVKVNWTQWRQGQPDNDGHLSKHCATVGCGAMSGWTKHACTAHYPFACESILSDEHRSDACPPSWQGHDWKTPSGQLRKHCYTFNMEMATWEEARKICQDKGGDLITMGSKEKVKWIKETYLNETRNCGGKRWWIGLNSLYKKMRWTWLNDIENVTFTDWLKGSNQPTMPGMDYVDYDYTDYVYDAFNLQPAVPQPPRDENIKADNPWPDLNLDLKFQPSLGSEQHDDRVVLMLTVDTLKQDTAGRWANVPHTSTYPALCEISHGGCVESTDFQFRGHCYTILTPAEWTFQEQRCLEASPSDVSYLAVIDNVEELKFLRDKLTDMENAKPGVFIGLNAFERPHNFTWLSKRDEYKSVVKPKYRNWLEGEPHRHPRHRCVMAAPDKKQNMAWSDGNCLIKLRALCRRTAVNSKVYYDFRLRDSIYKVTHQKVSGQVDFDLLCSRLLGDQGRLVTIDGLMEYHLLVNFIHFEFSGSVELWVRNYSMSLQFGTHVPLPKVHKQCPPVLRLSSGRPNLSPQDCCRSRYALCEKPAKKSTEDYDIRVGNKLYTFVTEPTPNITYNDAQMSCRNLTGGRPASLLVVSSEKEYMDLSAEMKVLHSLKKVSQYWVRKSMAWIDFKGNGIFVTRRAGTFLKGMPCLVASIGENTERRLTKHDYMHTKPESCDKKLSGYICQSYILPGDIRREHNFLKGLIEDMLTRYFRFNKTFIRPETPSIESQQQSNKKQGSACGSACVGLAVSLPIMCIVFFVFGFLVARHCRKAGYQLMVPGSRRHLTSDSMDMPFTLSS